MCRFLLPTPSGCITFVLPLVAASLLLDWLPGETLDELLTLVRTSFPTKQYELLAGVLATFVYVMRKLQNAKTSITRFQRMLFGHRTEHKRNVLERAAVKADLHGQDGLRLRPRVGGCHVVHRSGFGSA